MPVFKLLHPAVPVTAGFILILLTQRLDGIALASALAASVGMCLVAARGAWWRLFRRLRYMLLVLAVLFAWQTPGVLVWPALGDWGPTRDGIALAAGHAARIVLAVSVVAFMLRHLSHAEWVQGVYGLCSPLERLGFPAERLALRLQLVLQDAEQADRTAWREALSPRAPHREAMAPLWLAPPEARDFLVIGVLCALAAWGMT